jgi:hypothetical protein
MYVLKAKFIRVVASRKEEKSGKKRKERSRMRGGAKKTSDTSVCI